MGQSNCGAGALRAFGQYRLLRRLAVGGMAEIFLAKQVGPAGFERDVVIKRLRPEFHHREDYVTMFLDEARLAARLIHPNLAQIHDLGVLSGHYFICMEYLAGEDLAYLLRKTKEQGLMVPGHLAAQIVAEAAQGLHYAHELTDETGQPQAIVHRDISPANLLVTYTGNVKVLDFGVARAATSRTITGGGQLKGKAAYAAPEQVRGQPLDCRCDIYMLGLTLYETLTLTQPFAVGGPVEVMRAVLAGRVAPIQQLRPEVPNALAKIVMKAMAQDPKERYPTAGDLAGALQQFLYGFTSNSSRAELRAFVKGTVGKERVQARTQIPSLQAMRKSGMRVSGFSDPEVPAAILPPAALPPPVAQPAPAAQPAARLPPAPLLPPMVQPALRQRWPLGLPLAGVLLLAVAVAIWVDHRPEVAKVEAGIEEVHPPLNGAPAIAPGAEATTALPSPVVVDCDRPGALGECPTQVPVEAGQLVAASANERVKAERTVGTLPPQRTPAPPPHRTKPQSEPETRATGQLTLDTQPWTRVYVDGQLVGETPVVELALPAGQTRLRLVNPERGIDQSVQVRVRPNQLTALRLNL